MRVLLRNYLTLALVAAAAVSCDSLIPTGGGSGGRLDLEIPRLAADGAVAAQLNTDISRINVRITNTTTNIIVFSGDFTTADLQGRTAGDPVSGTLRVNMPLPDGADTDVFDLFVEVFNGVGEVLFRIGPSTFQFVDGRAQLQVNAEYVGPGSNVTGVHLEPRSLVMVEGEQKPVSCVGTPGDVTVFPFIIESSNTNVASVNGTSVTAHGPGSATIRCILATRSGVTDEIPVTVTGRPDALNVLSGAGQTAPAGQELSEPIRFEVRRGGQPLSGVRVQVMAQTGGGFVGANEVTTGGDGSAQVTWRLGSTVGQQTILLVVPGTELTQVVSATATQPASGGISGTTRNAENGNILPGVTVEIRAGANNTDGAPIASAVSNGAGAFAFSNVPAGTYSLRATAVGFAQASANVTVGTGAVGVTLSLSPLLSEGAVRIVLSWATEEDLDIRLTLPGGELVNWQNVARRTDTGGCTVAVDPFACLDQDAFMASDGAESIRLGLVKPGVYTLEVHHYTADAGDRPPTDRSLASSGARVAVYMGTSPVPAHVFDVPDLPGNFWTVFTMSGSSVTPVNVIEPKDLSEPPPPGAFTGVRSASIGKRW